MYMILPALVLTCACTAQQQHPFALHSVPTNPGDVSVGFDLKFGYGTAAVQYPNGSFAVMGKVESSEEYRDMFRRLSLWENTHIAPPYTTASERWTDRPRQLKRRALKALGQPSSPDVAALSTLIASLKTLTENVLGAPITAAAASLPRLPAIYDEDLYDAFDYANLSYLQIARSSYHRQLLTYESMAALAGHNFSLCANVTHPHTCSIQDLQATYYTVDYSHKGLFAYYTLARSAYYVIETTYFDLDLGSSARRRQLKRNSGDEKYYWAAVREVLLRPLLDHTSAPPEKVILVGEADSVEDADFRATLEGVLAEFFGEGRSVPRVVDGEPLWVQAKGTAELVRRRRFLPEPVKPEGWGRGVGRSCWSCESLVGRINETKLFGSRQF